MAGCTSGMILGGDATPDDATMADTTADLDASAVDMGAPTDARRDARRPDGAADGASDATDDTTVDAGSPPCDAATCGFGRLCRRTTTSGGECMPRGDAAQCPPGTMASGMCCMTFTVTYDCVTRPIGCLGGVDCTCAALLCTVPGEPSANSGCFEVRDGVLSCYHALP